MQVESSSSAASSSFSSTSPTLPAAAAGSSGYVENDPIEMCLAEIDTVFDDATVIMENMRKFLDFGSTQGPGRNVTSQVIKSRMSKMAHNSEVLEHQYFCANPESRPLEKLQQDLEEKDKLIASFTVKLDKWKGTIDEYKARTLKTLIDEDSLNN